MTFSWETECFHCKEIKKIQNIIGQEAYCSDCYAKIVKIK